MAEPYRAAVYYAPEADDPLWALGCTWLARDPETENPLPAREINASTAEPSRYGFHATLKAPMRLRHGLAAFLEAAEVLARRQQAFALPNLMVAQQDGFLVLELAAASPRMEALAAACVVELDPHRRPETMAEQARRAAGRTPVQRANIAQWGYPLVLEQFRFHMTLTNSLRNNPYLTQAEDFFGGVLTLPRRLTSIAVFIEATAGAPFRLLRRLSLQP